MIKATFKLASEMVDAIVDRNNLYFMDVGSGQTTTITGLKISKAGVLLEFPDLKDDPDWRMKSINRLKDHIKKIEREMDKMIYVKDELIKFGYTVLHYQRAGHRPQRFK